MTGPAPVQSFTCHWMSCAFKAHSREDMVQHTEAHLETYLPIKQKDYATWKITHMGDITSGTDDSLLALVNNGRITDSSIVAQPPGGSHVSATAGGSSSTSTPTPPPNASQQANIPSADYQTPPISPGAISQMILSPVMSSLQSDGHVPTPSTATSRRSFASLNAIGDTSPQVNREVFSSPSPGTLWSGIGNINMDARSPSRVGMMANALRPGAYTGFLPLVFPKSPSPTNLLIPKRSSDTGFNRPSDRLVTESVADLDSIINQFDPRETAPLAGSSSENAGDHLSTSISGPLPLTRSRSRSRTPNQSSTRATRVPKRPPPGAPAAPPSVPGSQQRRPQSRPLSRQRSVLPALKPLRPLEPLKPPPASLSTAGPASDTISVPRMEVGTISGEKGEAMDVDIDGATEPADIDRKLGAEWTPDPALATERKNVIIRDSSAYHIGAPSQPDWTSMTTQAPHGSLSDL